MPSAMTVTGSPVWRLPSTYSSGRKCSTRRHRQLRLRSPVCVVHQLARIVAEQAGAHLAVEVERPLRGGAARHPPQVMHHVAGAEQQHALVAQRRQPDAELVVIVGRLGDVQAQLHHRDIGLRIELDQHRPGAVIQAPVLIRMHLERRQQGAYARRQRRIAGRRIAQVEQRLRKAAEIVDGRRRRHRGDAGAMRGPVGGDDQDRARTRQDRAEPAPDAGVDVLFQRIHRAAVAEKYRRHAVRSGWVHGLSRGGPNRFRPAHRP